MRDLISIFDSMFDQSSIHGDSWSLRQVILSKRSPPRQSVDFNGITSILNRWIWNRIRRVDWGLHQLTISFSLTPNRFQLVKPELFYKWFRTETGVVMHRATFPRCAPLYFQFKFKSITIATITAVKYVKADVTIWSILLFEMTEALLC